MVGKPFTEIPWWSYAPAVQQQLRTAIEQASRGDIVHIEVRIRPQEGRDLDLVVTMTPHLDADRHIEYLILAGIDITTRKRAEAEIHALIDAIPQLVWTMRPDGYIDYYNQRWLDYTGLSTEQAQGDGWIQCLHPDDQQRIGDAWQMSRETGTPFETEQRLRHGTTGEYRWFLVRGTPVRDEAGQILRWFGTCTDIKEQKRTEQQLNESRESLRVLAETVPQLVWTTLPDGLVTYWNHRWYDYIGSPPKQSLGHAWSQFLHPDDYVRTMTVWHYALEAGEPYETEYRLKKGKTGSYRWFLARGCPVRNEAGQILKWFGTCTDIEDQKRIEEALRQSQERVNALMNSSIIGITIAEGSSLWTPMTPFCA